MSSSIYPQFPLYVVSKGRYDYMVTSKALTEMGVKHFLVVENNEAEDYLKAIGKLSLNAEIVILDHNYKNNYELCDNYGLRKSTGPGPARNFAWDHSIKNGFSHHWVMDDNIRSFRRLTNMERIKCSTPAFWAAMEDFVLRYKNVSMAGPNYNMFAFEAKIPPFIINTRIYSCNLIRNDVNFRWRGRYNEDTILSLDMLKSGWCTIQFNAFLQEKIGTQVLKGGNTGEFYHKEGELKKGARYSDKGTMNKSLMLLDVHPDVSRVVHKFGRIHHHVNYTKFKNQKLIRRNNFKIKNKDYGFKLVTIK